jgi:hypothetical protein
MPSDNSLLCLILEFQVRSLYVQQLLQAESAKEYDADWLPEAKKVMRDGTGKFAKKGASITQSIQDTTAILKQGFDLTGDTIQSLVKDPEFRKRAGLATGLPMAKLISNLATQAKLNPKLTEKLDEWIANATKEFADQYGDDKSPMAQAIRKANLAQPPKDASFNEKMEFRVVQYAAYQEALKNPEDFSKRDEIIGKAAAASIPIGVSLAIALGFEVAIPLFLAQSVNWATVLSSVALGEAADFAVQKGLDKLEINNPAVRIGASMVAGALAGGLVTGVNNKIKNTQRLTKEEIKKSTQGETERLAKEGIKHGAIETKKLYTPNQQIIQSVANKLGINWEELETILESLNQQGLAQKENDAIDEMMEAVKNRKKHNYRKFHDDKKGDLCLYEITKQKEFHELPKVLPKANIDELLKVGEHIELYRGVLGNSNISHEEIVEEFKNGIFYQGNGIYGQGTYTAVAGETEESINAAVKTATYYATNNNPGNKVAGAVQRMIIHKKAKGIDGDELKKIIEGIVDDDNLYEPLRRLADEPGNEALWILRKMVADPGYVASLLGYDFFFVKATDYNRVSDFITILNRGIVTIQDEIDIIHG